MDKDITPVISVIMPVYNCAEYVAEAIQSILNQTFGDFELIIIDDCSTDETLEVIGSFTDPRIRLELKPANSGYTESLNLGLKLANGKYTARMDGDDISMLNRFERQATFLKDNPDVMVCGTWFTLSSTGATIQHPEKHDDIKLALLSYNAIGHPTVMFRRSFFKDNNLTYDSTFEPAEDYDLWARIVHFGKTANIPESLLLYREHRDQISKSDFIQQQAKSNHVRKRMLFSLLDNVADEDDLTFDLISGNSLMTDIGTLQYTLGWLNELCSQNNKKAVFKIPGFEKFIKCKNNDLIRNFFFCQPTSNLNTLFDYFTISTKFKISFTSTELIKLFLKCIWPLKFLKSNHLKFTLCIILL